MRAVNASWPALQGTRRYALTNPCCDLDSSGTCAANQLASGCSKSLGYERSSDTSNSAPLFCWRRSCRFPHVRFAARLTWTGREPCYSAVIENDILALKTFVALLYLGQIIEMCNALGTCQGILARGISLTAAPPTQWALPLHTITG